MNLNQWENSLDDREFRRQIRRRDRVNAWIAWEISVGGMAIIIAASALVAWLRS